MSARRPAVQPPGKYVSAAQVVGTVAGAVLNGKVGTGTPVIRDYETLLHLPKINSVELTGNKNARQLSLQESMEGMTNLEIEKILTE